MMDGVFELHTIPEREFLQSIDESLYLIGCPFVTPPKAL
jgi:hypothetical protein